MVTENLYDSIERSDAQINWPQQGLPTVHVDPVRMVSIFQNLLGNALKYRKKKQKPVIDVGFEERMFDYLFSVTDNGIGMKSEYIEKIFEPFQRLHAKDEYSGTGMGLSICRKSVETMGGQLWAESALGKGSTFYFTLPK